MIHRTVYVWAAFALAVSVLVSHKSHAEDDNPLADPSFELGLPPDEGGWIPFDESMISSRAARTGRQSMFNWGYSRSVPYPPYFIGTVSGSYQEFPASPGSRWRLTGYGLARARIKGGPAFGILQVSFFDQLGNDLGTLETVGNDKAKAKLSNEMNAQSPVGEWVFLDTGIATAPEDTVVIQAFTLYVDFSGSDTSQGVYFDDLHLCAVDDGGASSRCGQEFVEQN